MPEYVVIEDPDGAQYAVPADSLQRHPQARVIGREGDTGVPQPLEPETASAPEHVPSPAPAPAPAPEEAPAEQVPAPEAAAPVETPA